jgi:hypothetical protein
MLTSINPLGQRGRGHQWGLTVALFTLASVVGGATTGLVCGALGEVIDLPVWVGAIACAAAVLLDLTRVPTLRRQVDEDWLTRYRMWVYATGFGWQLGTGVVTIVTSAATYAFLVLLVVAGLPAALVAGAVFGLVRALPLLLARRADSPERLRALARRLETCRATARALTVVVLAAAAGLLAVA